jgi:hypothetical protein
MRSKMRKGPSGRRGRGGRGSARVHGGGVCVEVEHKVERHAGVCRERAQQLLHLERGEGRDVSS